MARELRTNANPEHAWNIAQALRTSRSFQSSLTIAKNLTRMLDMSTMVIIPNLVQPTPPVVSYAGGLSWLNSQPKSFMSTYNNQEYRLKNPISLACQKSSLPFVWRTSGPWSIPMEKLDDEQRRILRFTEDHGISAGIKVPVHLPHGKVGSVAFFSGRKLSPHLERILQDNQPSLMATGIYLLNSYWNEHRPASRDETAERLTPRELTCIRMVSRGLSDKIIAAQLTISPSTARFHVDNAVIKLGAVNRREAAVLATKLGLL